MSRTIRKRKGYRWFAEKQQSWALAAGIAGFYETKRWDKLHAIFVPYTRIFWNEEPIKTEFDKKLIAECMRDGKHYKSYLTHLKDHSNSITRAAQRKQLRLVMLGQDYDISQELLKTKGLAWSYD